MAGRDGVFHFTDLEREQTTDDERWPAGTVEDGAVVVGERGQFTRQVFEDETYQHGMIPARNGGVLQCPRTVRW